MENLLDEIRDQQKDTWNKFSPGWKEWDKQTMDFLKPVGEEMIRQLNPKGQDQVLDLASGTGEPGLTIATKLKGGKLIVADLSEKMLAVAREHAEKRGIQNIETVVCDACNLPFADSSFDLVSCRFGIMFFPDMALAIQEMKRVLKPGGSLSLAVWAAPEKNFWITAIIGTIREHIELPPPPKDAPGIFRCAEDGLLAGLLIQEGLKNVKQQEVSTTLNLSNAEEYWRLMMAVAAPVVAALDKVEEATKSKIQEAVYRKLNEKYPEGKVSMEGSAYVVYGEK